MNPPELTGAERRALRAEGQLLVDRIHVGHHGATDAVRKELDGLLTREQLVKVRASETDRKARKVLFETLAASVGAALINTVGRTAVVFRPAAQDPEA
jgi:RNA-binding protein